MSTVVCFKCKRETEDYDFENIGSDIKPVCRVCRRREKVMKELVDVHESRLKEVNFKGDITLSGWLK